MRKILVINGPNLNMLGRREPGIYGNDTLADLMEQLSTRFPQVEFIHKQSNHEGMIIDTLQEAADCKNLLGVILNAGAYTHTSLAIADAIRAIAPVKVVEVHISNIFAREPIRHTSLIAAACAGSISGFGFESYALAAQALISLSSEK